MPALARPVNRNISDEVLQTVARETVSEHFLRLKSKGKTTAQAPEQFYGFRPQDVIEMHFYKQGFGRGVWYRLKDGRVINALGRQSEREREWYVSSAH